MSEDVDRVMFVYANLELPVTVASAIERLDRVMASQRLADLSDQAYEKGLITMARVGPFGAVRGLSKAVRLQMLEPRPIDNGVRVQLRWVATGATGQLYPTLDADLDITGVNERHCALSVNAVYTPPLGAAGASIDRLLLHLAARATIRSLLRGLGHALSDPSPAAAHGPARGWAGSASPRRRQAAPYRRGDTAGQPQARGSAPRSARPEPHGHEMRRDLALGALGPG